VAGSSWHNTPQRKTGLFKQGAILLLGSFASIRVEQHFQVNESPKGWRMALGKHHFGNQKLLVGFQSPSAIAENRQAMVIIPIMQNLLEDAGVDCWRGREGLEEVTRNYMASLFQPSLCDQFACPLNRLGMIEEYALQRRMRLQKSEQKRPLATSDSVVLRKEANASIPVPLPGCPRFDVCDDTAIWVGMGASLLERTCLSVKVGELETCYSQCLFFS
jgi:hypothetical protein